MDYTHFDDGMQREHIENLLRGAEANHLQRSLDVQRFQAYLDAADRGEFKSLDQAVRVGKVKAWKQSRDDARFDVTTHEMDIARLRALLAGMPKPADGGPEAEA